MTSELPQIDLQINNFGDPKLLQNDIEMESKMDSNNSDTGGGESNCRPPIGSMRMTGRAPQAMDVL